MTSFTGEFGLQFTLHIASNYTAPEIVEHARLGHELGFSQIWVNDNLRYRQQYVVLTAIAAQVPISLGTAVTVPYFRNPVDFADTLATLSEFADGREISVGISRGDLSIVGNQLTMRKPIAMVRETVAMSTALLAGERVCFGDYPALAEFYHLLPDAGIALAYRPRSPIRFYTGSNGPRLMAIAGRIMDGVLFSGLYITYVKLGRIPELLAPAEEAGRQAGRTAPFRKVAEVNVSVSQDRAQAREFPRKYAAHAMVVLDSIGVTDEQLARLGIRRAEIQGLKDYWATGATVEEVALTVTDAMVDACFVAGTPEEVADGLAPVLEAAAEQGIDQVLLSKLGPDYAQAIEQLSRAVRPRRR
jgi:alkanesulfonate monooxygenase SsuD/methylene tetrahydromethanopterin reductase-like flavin-dependent oxidoreductase (luciferase family)